MSDRLNGAEAHALKAVLAIRSAANPNTLDVLLDAVQTLAAAALERDRQAGPQDA